MTGLGRPAGGFVEPPLRICIVVLDFAPKVGGAEIRAEKQARALRARGHDVVVVTSRRQRRWPAAENLDGLPVHRFGGVFRDDGNLRVGRLGIWPVVLGVFRYLWTHRREYDVIHVFDYSPLAAAAGLVARLAAKPIVITFQNTGLTGGSGEPHRAGDTCVVGTVAPSLSAPGGVSRGPDRIAGRRGRMQYAPTIASRIGSVVVGRARQEPAPTTLVSPITASTTAPVDPSVFAHAAIGAPILDWCIRASRPTYQALSTRGRRDLLARGFDPDRVVLISGSVDTAKFAPAAELEVTPPSVRTIACVARLDYAKGVDILLRAWSELMRSAGGSQSEYQSRLLVIGDGRLRRELEDLARDLAVTDSVEFAGERTDIAAILPAMWGFVLPSRREGMPNALLEAMACGLPCVATRVSGTEDIVTDGVDGVLVEPENPQQLAAGLRRILNDSALKQELGSKARERVMRDYSLSRVVDESIALYRSLMRQCPERLVDVVSREGVGG